MFSVFPSSLWKQVSELMRYHIISKSFTRHCMVHKSNSSFLVTVEKYSGEICPNILIWINKNQKLSRNFYAIYSGENEYQIQRLLAQKVQTQHVVDFVKKTFTRGMFQLCGYSCSHTCKAIGEKMLKLEDFVYKCYGKDEY